MLDRLVARFWPGPFTLILPREQVVPDLVTAGLTTVAVRMSAHPVFDRVINVSGKPLAAPSANRFGRISPTTAQHVLQELGGRIRLIVDGGQASKGVESTVVRIQDGQIEILRKGPVTAEELSEIAEINDVGHVGRILSPGQTPSHYAPSTPLLLVGKASEFTGSGDNVGLLAWDASDAQRFAEVRWLSPNRDLIEAASRLFSLLRELDDASLDFIVAESVPETGIGAAIMDRLRRASAARVGLEGISFQISFRKFSALSFAPSAPAEIICSRVCFLVLLA